MAGARASDARSGEQALLAAAQRGNEQAFVGLTSPHRRARHIHCYRMLGSLHDADDALQETLLRAWKGLPRFEPRAPLVAWLFRIATNVSLRMIEQRRNPGAPVDAHLQPYPDRLLDELPAPHPGPEEVAATREGVGLAFVAALQLLPPKQRAVLVLRDALDWPAREVAELLEDTVPAVNSALQRARERIGREQQAGKLARLHAPASAEIEASVMRSFQEAWAALDIERIVALLTDDATLTMPPIDVRIVGAAAVGEFFATEPLGGHIDRIALVPTRASGQPGFACYADEHDNGDHAAYGVMVFALRGDKIAGITGFPQDTELFEQLGAPPCSPRDRRSAAGLASARRERMHSPRPDQRSKAGSDMAIGIYFAPQGMSVEKYDDVIKQLQDAGQGAPAGRTYHAAFEGENGLQVFDVWDSQAAFDAFGETLMPILVAAGIDPGEPMISSVHSIIIG